MKQVYGVVLSLGILLALGVYLTRQTATPSASRPVSVRAPQPSPAMEEGLPATVGTNDKDAKTQRREIAALSEQVVFLRREVAALQRQFQEQRQEIMGVAVEGETPPLEVPRPDPTILTAMERERQEQMAAIEASFRQEPSDPQWSFAMTGVVQEALAGEETLQTALQNLECRSSTCRVEIADDDAGELAKSMPVVLQQLASTLPNVIADQVEDGGGNRSLLLYLSRE